MVRTLLERIAIDCGASFEVIEADVLQDVNTKIDFIIHRNAHRRGARVQETATRSGSVGIQFTTDTRPETLEHKHEQVARARRYARTYEHVDDIVVVSVPLAYSQALVQRWDSKRVPGGPTTLWDSTIQEQVVRGVLGGIVPSDEIDEIVRATLSPTSR